MLPHPNNAITTKYIGRQRVLHCDVVVRPFDGNVNEKPSGLKCSGIWDTGATNSAIDERIVEKLSLKPIDRVDTSTANGIRTCNVYMVNITIQNNITKNINVTEASLNGVDMLIGMDVIGDGDFAISTDSKSGSMYLSFQIPSQGKIDFVERATQAKNKHRAILRRKNRKK